MCVCVYVCTYVCMYICMYVCACVCVCVCVCVRVGECVWGWVSVRVCVVPLASIVEQQILRNTYLV